MPSPGGASPVQRPAPGTCQRSQGQAAGRQSLARSVRGPGGTGCGPLGSLDRRLGGFPRPARSRRPEDHSTRSWMWDQGGAGLPALDASRIWMLCDSWEWEERLDLDRTEESLPGGSRGFRSPVPHAADALVTLASTARLRRRLSKTPSPGRSFPGGSRVFRPPLEYTALFPEPGAGGGADRGAQWRTPILWPHTPPTELLPGPELGSPAPHRGELRQVPTALRSSSRKDSARPRVPAAGGAKPWDLAGLRLERSPGAGSGCGAG